MSRGAPAAFTAALSQPHVNIFPLFEFGFDSGTDYAAGLAHDVTWGGHTYLASLGVMTVGAAVESSNTNQGLTIALAAATPAALGIALGEPVQGRSFVMRLAAIDAAGAVQVDPAAWVGTMDTLTIVDGASPTYTIAIEPRTATWDRPRLETYSDAWLQARASGDTSLRYMAEIASRVLAWPSASYFFKR